MTIEEHQGKFYLIDSGVAVSRGYDTREEAEEALRFDQEVSDPLVKGLFG